MTVDELNAENERRIAIQAAALPVPADYDAADEVSFEAWARRNVIIRDKRSGRQVPFILNAPQRRVLSMLEAQRIAGKPIRLIMLKARQWGGSTLVQHYMAWIQMVHRRNWHSLVCAQNKNTASTIRGMFDWMLRNYPCDEDGKPFTFKPYQGSSLTRYIAQRGCCVTVASAENPDATRGLDVSMAHLSEVAFWPETPQHSGEIFAQNICSGIPLEPYSLIAMESTAKGVGNFFHNQWLRAEAGESAYTAVFVPWYEIAENQSPVDDVEALWTSLTPYERTLWEEHPVTLEQLAWYHAKVGDMPSPERMRAEYPSTAAEAFVGTSMQVFSTQMVEVLRKKCCKPAEVGDVCGRAPRGPKSLENVHFVTDETGALKIWRHPESVASGAKYVVTMDVGGRTDSADWSVIAVIRRPRVSGLESDTKPEVVAQWRGHTDHDQLAWIAARIARYYNDALLVIESNSLEGGNGDATYILSEINHYYNNMYYRTSYDRYTLTEERRVGFHTNRFTKPLVIHTLIGIVRDLAYIEYDNEACNELLSYESNSSGVFAARRGCHDDILMTRAIGLYVISTLPPLPAPATDATHARENTHRHRPTIHF